MRIERKGKVDPLTPRWRQFLVDALGGQDLDDLQSPEELRADYACLSGLLALELKTLEEDGSERMDNLTDEMRKRSDWPIFLGSAPIQAMADHTDDPDGVRLKFIDRMGRAIVNHLKKANKQLGAHAASFPRKNLVRVMLLVNEDHEIYEPMVVGYILQHALRRQKDGLPLYPNIDAVIFTSERHATRINNQIAFPILSVEGPSLETDIWKRAVLNEVLARWSIWNEIPLYSSDMHDGTFETIDHIPDQMPRHEMWRLEYRRNPYLRDVDDNALRSRFDEAQVVLTLMAIKSAPVKPSPEAIEQAFILFTHIMVEMAQRGITAPQFALLPERLLAAAKRLSMPLAAIEWFSNLEKN